MALHFFEMGKVYKHPDFPGYFVIPIYEESDYQTGYCYRDCWVVDLNAKTHLKQPLPLTRVDISILTLENKVNIPDLIKYFIKEVQKA